MSEGLSFLRESNPSDKKAMSIIHWRNSEEVNIFDWNLSSWLYSSDPFVSEDLQCPISFFGT